MRKRTVILDINESLYRVLKYKQYDHNNILEVMIKEQGEFIDISTYTTRAFYQLPSGKIIQRDAEIVDVNTFDLTIDNAILEEYGKTSLEIVVSNGETIVTTFRIHLDVEKSINRDSAIEGNSEWDIITDGLSVLDKVTSRISTIEQKITDDSITSIVSQTFYTKEEIDVIKNEVVDARDGETSLKARLDRDIEKAKQVYVNVEGSHISTDSSSGYLKDIEILGNTIQDASNLADIRSVGDTVEGQELYEIPVLSCGKNLYKGSVYVGKVWSTSTVVGTLWDKNQLITNNGYTAFDMFEIPNHLSQFAISSNGKMLYGNIKFFDKDKKYIKDVFNEPFVIPEGAKYCCGHFNSSYFPDAKIQLEEGTQATPYEPYIEDKLTILSPVQLEKVGDIADRIIEKDGVWGVEKNVVVDVLDDKNFTYNTYTSNTNIDLLLMNKREYHSQKVDVTQCILEGFKTSPNGLRDDISYINLVYENPANTVLIVDKGTNLTTAKQRVLGKKIYRILANPKFIPLPHDQQVKLRTFANKTNISFLTEIEGTIKAQVPKSIGATVNTHTEQINNLNKELDRVKKLEESTVSTVTTESDFTTVEATSNGYFEDVKLEGKTLANIVTTYDASKFSFKEAIKQEDGYYKLQYGATVNDTYVIPRYGVHLYKPNTTYTIIVDIKENTAGTLLGISAINSCIDTETISKRDFANLTGISTTTFKTRDDITISDKGVLPTYDLYFGIWKDGGDLSKYITFKYWVLEGDHTQNPPSFFEGLKSVGQDVDEISVSSCNGNYLNNDKFIEHIKNVASGVLDSQNKTITFSASNASKIHYKFNDLPNGSYILVIKGYNTDATQSSNITINYTDGTFDYVGSFVDGYAVREISKNKTLSEISGAWQIGSTVLYYDECYLIKSDNLDYTYKQDKKRLLYYNTETQTWEKPILREWDSIEKHANGKYYYHQRSGEVVLNGSENWSTNDGFSTGEYIACLNNSALPDKKQGVLNIISDKFNTKNCASIPVLEEGMWGEVGNSVLYMSISKSKLSTQDVEGFKQWLQTNNVTVVYQLAQEKVYECTNIDLITYNGETNYLVESGVLSPRTTLKVMANISNVVLELQRKASLLENDCLQMFKYMLAGDMVSVAYMLYPEDFETTNEEDNIEGIEEDNIEGIEEDNIEAVEEDNIEAVEEDNIEETVNDNTEEQ